ncbi:MAG: TIGR04255 family protein [Alphaproteobacteria bacterium]|nr:TIGR04255 family protein [Alphaproteobacteria bacterium]
MNVDNFTSMLRLQADSAIIMQNKQYHGTVIDIDTFKNFQNSIFDINNIFELFSNAHQVEKKIFFTLLTDKFKTDTLGAVYDD